MDWLNKYGNGKKQNTFSYFLHIYVSPPENEDADKLSRPKIDDTEWGLCDRVFRKIISVFGTPEIDLFATKYW